MFGRLQISFLSIVVALLLFAFGTGVSYAQVGEGIEIRPAVIEDRVDPGETYRFSISVTNISSSPKTFYLTAQDITGLDDNGVPIFSDEEEATEYELSTWVTLPQSEITLEAGETRSIPYSIQVPQSASPGAHFGGVFLDAQPPRQRTTGSAVGMKVGSIINLRISGDALEEAQLREFSSGKIVYGTPNVDFVARMENLGNVLLRPHGLIEISDMWGKEVGTVRVNESGAPVFPGAEREFAMMWEYDGFAFGRYQAVLSLVYGEDVRKTDSAVTSFWVLPLKPILMVLGSLIAVMLVVFVSIQMYIKRKLREMGASGSRGAGMYGRKYQSPAGKLVMIAIALLLLCVAFVVLLFVMFA